MKTISISVKKRTDLGKKFTKELRKQEQVPCVMYGGTEVLHFYAHENDFRHLVYTPDALIVEIDMEGEKHLAIMQDLQFHPVTDSIQHIDFVEVIEGKAVTINIPVQLVGSAIGIKQGGKSRLKRRTLKVRGQVNDLPDRLDIDITKINIGDTIKVRDLVYDKLEVLDPAQSLVFAIVSSRLAAKGQVVGDEEEEEGTEGGEQGEGESEGGSEE